jgi:hypothetical protein
MALAPGLALAEVAGSAFLSAAAIAPTSIVCSTAASGRRRDERIRSGRVGLCSVFRNTGF